MKCMSVYIMHSLYRTNIDSYYSLSGYLIELAVFCMVDDERLLTCSKLSVAFWISILHTLHLKLQT